MAPFEPPEPPTREGEGGETQPDLWSAGDADAGAPEAAPTAPGPGAAPEAGAALGAGAEPGPEAPPEDGSAALRPSTIVPHFPGEEPTPGYAPLPRRPAPSAEPGGWYSTRREGPVPPPSVQPASVADVPLDAPGSVPGILVVAGGLAGLLGLLLPWAGEIAVIGSVDLPEGYLASWGLASPSNWVVLGLFGAVLVFALRTPPVRARLRYGWVPLVAGLFALGNAWPYTSYLLRGLGFGLGVWLVLAAAAAMIVGAALELRRNQAPPTV